MSIASLIAGNATSFTQRRGTISTAATGEPTRTDATTGTINGFLQPSGATGEAIMGRLALRQFATAYFTADTDIQIDDELLANPTGSPTAVYEVWRVKGYRRAGNLSSGWLAHLIVDLELVAPKRIL